MDPELLRERDDVLTRLANPGADDDVEALATRAEELVAEIEAYAARVARADEARARLAGTQVPGQRNARGNGRPNGAPGGGGGGRQDDDPDDDGEQVRVLGPRDLSRGFLQSEGLRAMRDGRSGNAQFNVDGDTRALVTTGTLNPQATRIPGLIAPPDRPTSILDQIDRQPIGTNALEYVQETLAQSNAATVAEGQPKPEASFTSAVVSDTIRTVATWVNLTRQAAEDDSTIQGYLEGRLTYGLGQALESQVVAGDGVAPNLRGIMNVSTISTYTAGAGEAAVISVRKAKTVAQLSGYPADTVAMNPIDWERVELDRDNNGAFRVTTSAQGTIASRIWGLAVVETISLVGSTSSVGGKFLVGGFRLGATLWERTGVRVLLTDSHASNFTSNILTLLVEIRVGLSVWRPAAFVKGTFSTYAG